MPRWQATGTITGEKLPTKRMDLGPLRITKVSATEIANFPLKRVHLATQVPDGQAGVALIPSRVDLRSTYRLDVFVNANDFDGAYEEIESRLLPRYLPVLHSIASTPYHVTIDYIELLEGRHPQQGWPSPIASGRIDTQSPFQKEDIDALTRRAHVADQDREAQRAARYLQSAIQLESEHDGLVPTVAPAIRAAALLNFLQVVESIARSVSSIDPPSGKEYDKERLRIIDHFRTAEAGLDDAALILLIRETDKELRRLNRSYTDLQIRHAAEVLDVPPAEKALASELHRFRNEHLGHPRTNPPPEKLTTYWLGENPRAYQTAKTFLTRFLDYKSARG
jgi:hypothetical protein